ncbi:MAG: M15 family metallopeptidase [Syntrophales bacterium]
MKRVKSKAGIAIFALLLAAAVETLPAGVCRCENRMPPGFVDLKTVLPSVILDIRYFGPHNFVAQRLDGYNAPKCILTKEAAEALSKVQKDLSEFSLTLKVYDCYRPQMAVDHFVRWAKDIGDTRTRREFYPTVDKKDLFRNGYIDSKSGHSRGSTVDLTIVPLPLADQESYTPGQDLHECFLPAKMRFKDNSVDMGTGFDCFHELSNTSNKLVGAQQRMNRMLLRTLMEKHGFRNYDKEWWHYTLINEPYPDTYFNFPID